MVIPDEIKQQVKEEFSSIKQKVIFKIFKKNPENPYSIDTIDLIKGVVEISDFLSLEVYDIDADKELAAKYQIEMTPAILIHSEQNEWPFKFYGIPAGYEFSALIEAIKYVGTGETGLAEQLKKQAESITSPKDIKVFVTSSCPYCSTAVLTAFQLAIANPKFITSQMIEASNFIELSTKFSVRTVPKIVINDTISFEGPLPAEKFLSKVCEK